MSKLSKILAVDDDPRFLSVIRDYFKTEYDFSIASDGMAAMKAIAQCQPELILLDFYLPEMSGLELLKLFKRRFSDIPIIMLTGESTPQVIIDAMKAGANDYVIKGTEEFETNLKFRIHQLLEKIKLLRKNQELVDQNQAHAEKNRKLSAKVIAQSKSYEILGISKGTLKLKGDIQKVKGTSAIILVTGENGTGKELVARAINSQEDDPSRPFVVVNCAAIPQNLFESEFFGHVKGSFTGATDHKNGQFTVADGGDIFLDEVGEIPLEMQAKLLRVIQEKTFTPVGAVKPITVDVRIIAATNRNLQEEIRKGRFREDLYYRLNQFQLHVPSLRERSDEILFLAEQFLKARLPMGRLTEPARKALLDHPWRGNIRELENTIERAVIMAKGEDRPWIRPEHLNLDPSSARPASSLAVPDALLPGTQEEVTPEHFARTMDWMERHYLERGLKAVGGSNESLYTRLGFSKAYYFKRKKMVGLLGPVEPDQIGAVHL